MKKVLLVAVVAVFGYTVSAQDGLRVGLNAGIPLGDKGDFAAFVANLDFEYDFSVSETVHVGVGSGVTVYSGKEDFADFKYVPILASVDLEVSDGFWIGGDVGYGVSLESNIDGDLVYRFQLRYAVSDHFDINGRFSSFSSGDLGTLSNASLGVGFRF
ncbi:hypothetical protein WIW50_14780 [Flavobacteriaceae bacterium 3-367]